MRIGLVLLLGDVTGRDFIHANESGVERFAARLMDHSRTLSVLWTESVPWTSRWLGDVQHLAGGPGAFDRVTGMASAELEEYLRAGGTLDPVRAAGLLGRSLGGRWSVQVRARPGLHPRIFDVQAVRLGD